MKILDVKWKGWSDLAYLDSCVKGITYTHL